MEKIVNFAVGVATNAVLTWVARYHDPIYSDGWFLNNLQWLYLPLIVAIGALIISFRNGGLVALGALAFGGAVAFGWLYSHSDQSEPWPTITWILHLVIFALVAGILAGLARIGYVWWQGLPPPPPAPAPAP